MPVDKLFNKKVMTVVYGIPIFTFIIWTVLETDIAFYRDPTTILIYLSIILIYLISPIMNALVKSEQ